MIERITEKERLFGYLSRDRIRAGYFIGGLDDSYDEYTEWWALSQRSDIRALLMVYEGLSMPAVFTLGGAEEVAELVSRCVQELPRRFYAHLLEEHAPAFSSWFRAGDVARIRRMVLRREDFVPAIETQGVRRLVHSDTAALMALYRYYPDHLFEPYQLESGLYFGADGGAGLIAAAGVHVVSRRYDVATIGNVVTHPEHRGHGHAARCTGRLLEDLLVHVSLVALNVREGNDAARATFRKIGFRDAHTYLEVPCEL